MVDEEMMANHGYLTLNDANQIVFDAAHDEFIVFSIDDAGDWVVHDDSPKATLATHSIGFLLQQALVMYIDDDEHFFETSRIYVPELSQEVIRVAIGGYTHCFEIHRHVEIESYVIPMKDGQTDIMSLKTGRRRRVGVTDTYREVAAMIVGGW